MEIGLQAVLRRCLEMQDWGGAVEILSRAVREHGDDAGSWHNLGLCHFAIGAPLTAGDAMKRAAVIAPDNARIALSHGRFRLATGSASEAARLIDRSGMMGADDARFHEAATLAAFAAGDDRRARAHALAGLRRAPLKLSRWAGDPDRLSVLVIFAYRDAPGLRPMADGSCSLVLHGTEIERLIDEGDGRIARSDAFIATDTDVEALARAAPRVDVIVSAIGDADEYSAELVVADRLCRLVRAPVVNPPSITAGLSRTGVSRLLNGLPGVLSPRCVLVRSGGSDEALRSTLEGFQWPVIVRPAGSHTGKGMAVARDVSEVHAACVGADRYVSEFVDFRSPDGWYRKFRARIVGDQIIADHLFFGDTWKVHGEVRDRLMIKHQFMQNEERRFIDEFPGNLNGGQREALQSVGRATGLDYLGIDFAILEGGRLVVFEANASMRSSYPEWERTFPMTRQVTESLASAFRQMLSAKAKPASSRSTP